MKVHVVREAFSLDGVDYPRGTELTDAGLIQRVLDATPSHIHARHEDIAAEPVPQPKSDLRPFASNRDA